MLLFALVMAPMVLLIWWLQHRKYAPLIRAQEQRLAELRRKLGDTSAVLCSKRTKALTKALPETDRCHRSRCSGGGICPERHHA